MRSVCAGVAGKVQWPLFCVKTNRGKLTFTKQKCTETKQKVHRNKTDTKQQVDSHKVDHVQTKSRKHVQAQIRKCTDTKCKANRHEAEGIQIQSINCTDTKYKV